MRVRIYRNLHKSCWSVMSAHTGRVVAHRWHVILTDASLTVRAAGRKRVVETSRKNVHAFITGALDYSVNASALDMVEVTYNPFRHASFVRKDTGAPVHTARVVLFTPECRAFAQV